MSVLRMITKAGRLYLAGINVFLTGGLTLIVDELLHRRWFDVRNIQYKEKKYIFVLKNKADLQQNLSYLKKSSRALSIISVLFSSICMQGMTLASLLYDRTPSSFAFIQHMFWFCVTFLGLYYFCTRDNSVMKPLGLSVLSSFHPITLLASSIIGGIYTIQRKRIQIDGARNFLT